MVILFFFFCSGATALIYEVIWSKYLTLLLGSTIQAQTIVLAVFMSGLAIGNKVFGRFADQARRPLALYGYVEIAIGVYAFCFQGIYKLADAIFVSVGSKLLDHTGWLLILKGVLSVGLLIGPTILMGGTLPLLAAWLQRNTSDPARRSTRFYSLNSLGAVCGAGLSGFLLVRWMGLQHTTYLAALVNLIIGAGVILISRSSPALTPASAAKIEHVPAAIPKSSSSPVMFRWGCLLVALTGGVSMGLEVLASRCLALIFGASLQVFAIVLIAFILGIGIGSAVIASPRREYLSKAATSTVLLLGAAVFIGVLVLNIENLVLGYGYAQSGLSRTSLGYQYHQIMLSIIAICVLGIPAAALGSVLPLWIRLLSSSTETLGDRVGRLLTWNTWGAMCGALLTGFILMPRIGLRGSFAALALILTIAALVTALASRQKTATVAGAIVGGFLFFVALNGGENWRYLLSSGIFRENFKTFPSSFTKERRATADLLFYEDAADATVSVESGPSPFSTREITLRINGKADASSAGDLSTQILLAQLPLMVKPDSKDVFCFGMGSGVTAGSTLGYSIDHLTVADNCEPVLRAAKLFAPWNNGVLTNERVHICREDARTVLKLNPQKYDVIISEPSNPWMVGIGSVFSRDFYQIAASRLKPGGIMTQWFHIYEVDDNVLNLVLRTFGSVFPSMEIWDVDGGDIVLLGSNQPWKSGPEVYRRAFELPAPRRDLTAIGLATPDAVLARQLASQRTAFAVPGPGRIQTDNLPILEYDAPRTFYLYLGQTANLFQQFDERTWQMDLASPEKIRSLAQLDNTSLLSIFETFSSVNTDLMAYLRMRISESGGSSSLLSMPCVFRGTNESLLFAPEIARTNSMVRELVNAEGALRAGITNPSPVIQAINQVLTATQDYNPSVSGWSAGYYASLGIKASLGIGNQAEAKSLLLRGLQLEPQSQELGYLSRIMIRDGILKPSDIPYVALK